MSLWRSGRGSTQWTLADLTWMVLVVSQPHLLSFHSLRAALFVALLKRFASPCVVLIRNKRHCKTQGRQTDTSTVMLSFSQRITVHSLYIHSISFVFLLFFHPPAASMLALPTHIFLSDTHGYPLDFDPLISASRDHSLVRLGEATENVCVFLVRVREREGISGGARHDTACDSIFFDWFQCWSRSDTCDVNVIALCLCCCLSLSGPPSSVTGLLMSPVICLRVHSTIHSQGCNLKNQ